MMSLSEGLVTDGAFQLLLPPSLHQGLHGELLLVVGPHVVDQVGRHTEGGIAFGAPVLSR